MILIAHRGNINGPRVEFENNPEYVLRAIEMGFDAEVDVWLIFKPEKHITSDILFGEVLCR